MCDANLTLPMPQVTPPLQWNMVVAESSCRDVSRQQGLGSREAGTYDKA